VALMPAVVEHHEHSGASWVLATRHSAPAVRGCVPTYVGYEERSTAPLRRLEVPHPNITVIINLGAPLMVHAPALHAPGATYTSFAAGLFDTVALTESTGSSAGIELNLTPLGMWQLLGMPMCELMNNVVSLDALFGPTARALEEQLRNTASWDKRFDLLDFLLAKRLQQSRMPSAEVLWAWDAIRNTPRSASVSQITHELGWSRRRLTATFRECVGMTPKAIARVVRFDRAVRHVRAAKRIQWSALAWQCGYADQSHLVREFREFAGLSPTEFVRQQTPAGLAAG
jgi:AraC-like DNA-binding protein